MSADLKYFTQTPILRQIGHRRLAKLLADFDQDLKDSKVVLPEPDPQNVDSFADLANALATQRLPPSLHKALLTIENAGSTATSRLRKAVTSHRTPYADSSADSRRLSGDFRRFRLFWPLTLDGRQFGAPDHFSTNHFSANFCRS